jgi:hypothetical protein
MVQIVKFVPLVIPIEKNQLKQKKLNKNYMKILGIGNAIVDVICKVDEDFLTKNNLTKSTMRLVAEKEFKQLLSNLNIERTIAGGSVANSIVGLSQLKNEVSFIGKINDDTLGKKYEEGLIKENVKYFIQWVEHTDNPNFDMKSDHLLIQTHVIYCFLFCFRNVFDFCFKVEGDILDPFSI